MTLRFILASGAILVGACGGSPTGPGDTVLSGSYQITGTYLQPPWYVNTITLPVWRFTVVSQDNTRIILDWTAGPLLGTLPVRDTALWNETAYRLDWRENYSSPIYIARIIGTTCSGSSFNGFTVTSQAWTACSLSR